MPSAETPKSYKSPVRKLMRFFEKSHNRWKAKHHQVKQELKRCQNRVAQGVSRAEALEAEVVRLRAREQALVREVEVLKTQAVARAVMPQERAGGFPVPRGAPGGRGCCGSAITD